MKVIAEICQNHAGNRALIQEMVAAAAEAGVHYVKSQSLRAIDLSFRSRFEDGINEGGRLRSIRRPYAEEFVKLSRSNFSDDDHLLFVETAKKHGVIPMTTIFSTCRIDDMVAVGYEAIKIASFDCPSLSMQNQIRQKFDKEIFISTGASFNSEVKASMEACDSTRTSYLHCVTSYPTRLEMAKLSRIRLLRDWYAGEVGYSDHSNPDIYGHKFSCVARSIGATIFERHFTLLGKDETKDGVVSVNLEQLKDLVKLLLLEDDKERFDKACITEQEYEILLGGESIFGLCEEELLNRDYYVGRFGSHCSDGEFKYNWE